MINQFATLLMNCSPKLYKLTSSLSTYDPNVKFDSSTAGYYLNINDSSITVGPANSSFVLEDFSPVALPIQLSRFYGLLYPSGIDDAKKEFLTFCYLQLVRASGMTSLFHEGDNRISYDLSELNDFFKIKRISPVFSRSAYKLNVVGDLSEGADTFIVTQETGNGVSIYSSKNRTYFHPNVHDIIQSNIFTVTKDEYSPDSSKLLPVGNSGLSISFIGPIDNFANNSERQWVFSAESPFIFDFHKLFEKFTSNERIVKDMLDYERDILNLTNENAWNQHFNTVYRFAGLVNSYIERVTKLWEKQRNRA